MKISLVVAASLNNAIGKDNKLLWHLPKDMKFFKNTTWAMPVIMGRKTFESMGSKPLNGRLNIVISRNGQYVCSGIEVVGKLEDALVLAEKEGYKEVFVIGGGEIYKQALPMADRLFVTRVDTTIEGDTFFPSFDEQVWKLVQEEKHASDNKHAFNFSFQRWER